MMTLFVILLSVLIPVEKINVDEQFEKGKNLFLYQDYKKTVKILEKLLYPKVLFKNQEKEIKCREYLGASYWFLKKYNRFENEFTAILIKNPDFKLDPFYYPAEMIEDLKKLKKRLVAMGILKVKKTILKKNKKKLKKSKQNEPKVKIIIKKVYIKPIYPVFLPFGIPQYYNGDNAKGTIFLVTQSLSLFVNVSSYFLILSLMGDDHYFSVKNGDYAKAKTYEKVLYISLGTFITFYALSVIDGVITFKKKNRNKKPSLTISLDPNENGFLLGYTTNF